MGIVELPNALQERPDGGRSACAPVGGFQWDDDEIGGTQRRIAGQRHSRRAVEKDVVVIRQKLGEGISKCRMEPTLFPLLPLGKILPGEMTGDGDDVDVLIRGMADEVVRLGIGIGIEQALDAGRLGMIGQKALRDIGLLVQVHNETTVPAFLADGGYQPAEMRFADAALEIERRNDTAAARVIFWHVLQTTV